MAMCCINIKFGYFERIRNRQRSRKVKGQEDESPLPLFLPHIAAILKFFEKRNDIQYDTIQIMSFDHKKGRELKPTHALSVCFAIIQTCKCLNLPEPYLFFAPAVLIPLVFLF